jgi:hypothetical protein
MKNLFLVGILIALIVGCSNSKKGSKQNDLSGFKDSVFTFNNRFIKIESITKDDYDKYPESDYKKDYDDSNIIKSQNDTLQFVIDSVNSVIFTDTLKNTDNSEIRTNKHLGNLLDYYIVETMYYESGGWTLVNKINGIKYDLVYEPYLSPNHKYIISFGGSLEYSVTPPGFQIWTILKDKLVKKVELDSETTSFLIEEIRWISDDKLAVKIGFGTGQQAYGILTIK